MNEKNLQNKKALEDKRQPCEVYSRIVGYLRPVQNWNDGKKAEYFDREEFVIQ